MDRMGIEYLDDLCGLYTGIPIGDKSVVHFGVMDLPRGDFVGVLGSTRPDHGRSAPRTDSHHHPARIGPSPRTDGSRIEKDGIWVKMSIDVVRIMRETFIARVEHRPTLGSTSDRAAQCAAQGAKELPLLVVADQQTAGRGRGEKRWWTGPGGLAFSLLLDARTVAAETNRSPLVSLAVAVAVVEAVAPRIPDHRVGIHWPNDVMVIIPSRADIPVCQEESEINGRQECLPYPQQGRKLSGILVEVLPGRQHVVGVGLNTNNTLADAAEELRDTATTLFDLTGRKLDPTDMLVELLKHMEQAFAGLRTDPKAIARRTDELCLQRGRTLTLRLGNRELTGGCRGIADDGALLLETSNGMESFYSGTIAADGK
jgi:BirA family biotin operon repressor/biotin-[acetyl-CoA-carboxylase] ligase